VAKCPRIEFELREPPPRGEFGVLTALSSETGDKIGQVSFVVSPTAVEVDLIEVDVQRCGVGTALYTKLAQFACSEGKTMRSDSARSAAAEGFWRKQVRKGRARCVPGKGRRVFMTQGETGGPQSWPCKRYRIIKCPVTSLRGVRRRGF
jgi:hypothetical protein